MLKKHIFPFIILTLCFPMAVAASDPTVSVDLRNDAVVISQQNGEESIIQYEDTMDIQAMKIIRGGDPYIVVLRWKKDVARLLLYNRSGKSIETEKVFTAKDAKDFSVLRLRYKLVNDKEQIQVRAIKLNEGGEAKQLLRKRYSINPNKGNSIKYKSSKETAIAYPQLGGLTDGDAGMKLYNYYRNTAGLFPVHRSGTLDAKCYKHATYMKLNDIIEHEEDPNLPGYSEEGDDAGRSSNITRQPDASMVRSMKILMNGTYHRILMIVNELYGVGFGIDGPSKSGSYFGCLEIFSDADGYEVSGDEKNTTYYNSSNTRWPVMVPGPGEVNVPTTLNQGEWPDPLENFGSHYPAGYPITATPGMHHTDLYLQLYDPEGNKVFAYFQPPGDQNDSAVLYQGSSYSLIPASPLRSHTRYKVRMTGKYDGNGFTKEWYFTTE